MRQRLRSEWNALVAAARALDRQTVFVLAASAVLVLAHKTYGSRQFFLRELTTLVPPEWKLFSAHGWWFVTQGVTGFVIPVLCLLLLFRRRPAEVGLGAGDWRFGLAIALAYVPLVAVGTWVLSAGGDFRARYPQYSPAARDWTIFLYYELLYLTYWIGWEYLWRGFVLFGTARTFGHYAIFVQMVPFAILHAEKPFAEQMLSVVGGVLLGAVVWRCRSFWIAVPIHSLQMMLLDLWCTLRVRTGVTGAGPGDFLSLFGG